MAVVEYYSGGKLHRLSAQPVAQLEGPRPMGGAGLGVVAAAMAAVPRAMSLVAGQADRFKSLFRDASEATRFMVAVPRLGSPVVVPTETLVVSGATKAEIKWLKEKFGVEDINAGLHGKHLFRVPEGGPEGVKLAAQAAKAVYERGNVSAAHPNFLRVMGQVKPSAAGDQPLWNYANDGNPGVPGADVAAEAAWTLTRGKAEVRVAVLDEGVDTLHPALRPAVVAEKDFVDGNSHARPNGNDAHGTACAGIIVGRGTKYPGLAPECSLVAARIAKGDGQDGWVFDDFETADAIDWAWDDAKADVLSNSWGGGPEVDVITQAIRRALTKGRGGRGAVVVFSAGNTNGAIHYPGTLPDVLTVGASNQWDVRKSPASQDGETWWGSCFGPELDLVAPGVKIATTDIRGAAGYAGGNYTLTFNGTSSAAPHVAAAAALILGVAPEFNEDRVREVITASVDRVSVDRERNDELGWGRLNIYSALRLARRG